MKHTSDTKGNGVFVLALSVLLMDSVPLGAEAVPDQLSPDPVAGKLEGLVVEELPTEACIVGEVACNSSVTGILDTTDCVLSDGSFYDFWEFQGNAGQTVTIDMTSNEFDTFLLLLDPEGQFAGGDDDGGEGLNSRVVLALGSSRWSRSLP